MRCQLTTTCYRLNTSARLPLLHAFLNVILLAIQYRANFVSKINELCQSNKYVNCIKPNTKRLICALRQTCNGLIFSFTEKQSKNFDNVDHALSPILTCTLLLAKSRPMPSMQTCNKPPCPLFMSWTGNSPPNSGPKTQGKLVLKPMQFNGYHHISHLEKPAKTFTPHTFREVNKTMRTKRQKTIQNKTTYRRCINRTCFSNVQLL